MDSWMLLGYRYDDGASGPCTGRSLNADWMSSSRSDTANHATDHSDDNWDGEDEKGEEGTEEYCQRTHTPWLESDEERLLSYKDKQGMEWMDICKRFPGRTPGAVKVRLLHVAQECFVGLLRWLFDLDIHTSYQDRLVFVLLPALLHNSAFSLSLPCLDDT